jgi:hypothetical protein
VSWSGVCSCFLVPALGLCLMAVGKIARLLCGLVLLRANFFFFEESGPTFTERRSTTAFVVQTSTTSRRVAARTTDGVSFVDKKKREEKKRTSLPAEEAHLGVWQPIREHNCIEANL